MAKMHSNMLPLGTIAPDFTLPDTLSGTPLSLRDLELGHGIVIMFLCNHCPYVKHIQSKLVGICKQYQDQGIHFIAISSNDAVKYPLDSHENMHTEAIQNGYTFPYLYDESQEVAKRYQAACTPDFYIFDKQLACVYRGRFDESTPGNDKPVTGHDLIMALDCLLTNKPINQNQIASVGCGIKWK
jgi:peroxiredoxin